MADYNSSYTGAEIDAAIGKAQSIEANPTLAGTESSLTGLQIGGTKYKVDGGSGKADKTDLTNIIATGSTNATGAKINAGTFFYLNGTIVQAKVDIASGATFTSGTNYETVTAGGLNALKSAITPQLLTSVSAKNGFSIDWNGSCIIGKIVNVMIRITATTSKPAGINTLASGFPVGVLGSVTGGWYCMLASNYPDVASVLSWDGNLIANRNVAWSSGDVIIMSGTYVMQ